MPAPVVKLDPFFTILTIMANTGKFALEAYRRRVPADSATANRVAYIIECLTAAAEKKPLPKLGGGTLG